MSYSTARVLALLELLEAHGRMRGQELADRLEVDTRTIRRYVMTLRDRGVPIEMERGRYGGYSLRPGYKRPFALTEREALSVAWGLLSIGRHDEGVTGGHSKRALDKLAQVVPQTTQELIRHLGNVVTFDFHVVGQSEPINIEHLKTVLYAAAIHRQIHIGYQAWSGETTERMVDPYHVVYRAGRWYLVGYCHLRTDLRVFRLDHIRDVGLQTVSFDPPHVDALAAVERAISQVPWRWEYSVRLHLSLAEASQRISPAIAWLEEDGQGEHNVIMRGYADDLAWLAHLLAGLRCSLSVLSPPELRQELLVLAEHISRIAADPGVASRDG